MRFRGWCLWLFAIACGRTGLDDTTTTLAVQPTALDFGGVSLHATATMSLTLSSSGLTPIHLLIDGPDAGGPFGWSGMSFTLGTHSATDIPVYFNPSVLGPAHANLHIRASHPGVATLDVPIAGTGVPFACDPQTPDGTPCQLWWAPCAVGPACRGGVCRSASAEAEMPGDLRWSFAMSGILPRATDELGDSYSLIASGGIVALDACGRSLWRSDVAYDSLLLGGETLVASSAAGRIDAFSRRDGVLQWTNDIGHLLGCDAVSCTNLRASPPVLTNQGALVVFTTSINAGEVRPSLLDFAIDGGLLAMRGLASEPAQFAIESAVADLSGNTYLSTVLANNPGGLLSYDPSGALRFTLPAPRTDPGGLAVNGTLLIGAGVEWALDGTGMTEIQSPEGLGQGWCGDVGAADARGTLYCFTSRATPNTVMIVPAVGTALTASLPSGLQAVSNLALGDPGELFVVAGSPVGANGSSTLVALDATTGAFAWTSRPFSSPTNPGGVLTLSATATLLASDPQGLYAVFAGQQQPPPSAYWSRSGGSPENRDAPSPAAGR
jgi:outer membrane protein assembly factor BamB